LAVAVASMFGSGTLPALGSNRAVFELTVEAAGGSDVPELHPKAIRIGISNRIFLTVLYMVSPLSELEFNGYVGGKEVSVTLERTVLTGHRNLILII